MIQKTFPKITILLFLFCTAPTIIGQQLNNFDYQGNIEIQLDKTSQNEFQFNGYTNYWHNTYSTWYRYGNLYKIAAPDVAKSILQSKVNIAEDMGIPGLVLQEGFVNNLFASSPKVLDQPSMANLEAALSNGDVLILVDPNSEVGKKVNAKIGSDLNFPEKLKSHQYGSKSLKSVKVFYLENDGRKVFVISSEDEAARKSFKSLVDSTSGIVEKYDFHKGWFGAETLLKSVTCTTGHPIEVIGKGMNEGNSWFIFSGYMDFLAKEELSTWVNQSNVPVVTDVGFGQIFGLKDYKNLQVQSMFTKESWIDYAHEKEGYIFRAVWDTLSDPYHYDGYNANEGNKEQIDKEDVPFILRTGNLSGDALSSMVLFIDKGEKLTNKNLWEAIMDRREVGVLEEGKMLGPAYYRNALQLLLLDRDYLEDYFGDRINIETFVEGYDLQVTIRNRHSQSVSGNLNLNLPKGISVMNNSSIDLNLPAYGTKTLHFTLSPSATSMDYANPIAVNYDWNGKRKSTLALLDLPQAISVHRLLYGHAPEVDYPVTIHNFSDKTTFPVKIEVRETGSKNKVVYKTSQNCTTSKSTFKDMLFKLEVPAGHYNVKVSALGVDYVSQLGVGKAEGKPYLYAVDLNSDGVDEYRMENDSIQVTLLATGARVIEYIIKSRDDNMLFKLWPKKAIDDKRSFRKRGYYPYGGFEDFLGQGSMETHQVYDTEIIQKEGDYVRLKMSTDYFGNKLEKTFTLYGNSPLLEVRFALTFKNPEANVLGPQPILELGKKHWTEDVYTIPELDGLHEYRMKPEKYYGRLFFLKEGWNAGYDTKEDITFVGAFPVDQPLFLHMWMNHPRNGDAHHYYTEFQPWTPIYQKSTMYFSYYLWGSGGPWENGVKNLRDRNLITIQK
jgi:hypothetical protein